MDLSVKLFRWYDKKCLTVGRWLPFAKSVIAIPFDPEEQPIKALTEKITRLGANQFLITPSLFRVLLEVAQSEWFEVTSVELRDDVLDEEAELFNEKLSSLRFRKCLSPDEWDLMWALIYRHPPRKAEIVVGVDGPGSRVVVLSNGIVHSSDEKGLDGLRAALEPAITV